MERTPNGAGQGIEADRGHQGALPDQSGAGRLEARVVEALRQIYDPEIPVNIHELGLIYEVTADPAGAVAIRMTLTAPGCPAAQSLPLEVEQRVREIPGVTATRVDVTFDPP